MIIGIGTDIVQISRIKQVLERHGDNFANRILTDRELSIYAKKSDPVSYLAKRFAAKEATVKALGCGIGPVSWHDMDVKNNGVGAPSLVLQGSAADVFHQLGGTHSWLSLSDETEYAVAMVVLEKSP